MLGFLPDTALWPHIREWAKKSKRMTVVTAYLGTRPERLLKWPRQSLVVAGITENTVRRGSCSARGALRLRGAGISVLQARDLHAKIYLFDRAAIVASANLSRDSASTLVEAGVLLTGAAAVPVRREVQRIVRSSVLLDDEVLRSWVRLEPKRRRGENPRAHKRELATKHSLLDGRTVWLIDTYPYEEAPGEARAKSRKEKSLSGEHAIPAARIDWFSACGRALYERVREGDWIVLWWQEGTRAEFGRLEGPYECLAPVDLGKGLRGARYSLAIVPRRLRSVALESRNTRALVKVLGRRQLNTSNRVLRKRAVQALSRLLT